MVRVLVADDDLDVHELVHDLLELNFRDVKIDRALSGDSFAAKIKEADPQYDLILLDARLEQQDGTRAIALLGSAYPDLLGRVVLLASDKESLDSPELTNMPRIPKPFSLDLFGEIVKKACTC